MEPTNLSLEHTKTWNLKPGSELRFEVELDETIKLTLDQGNAEYFGSELSKGHEYTFSGIYGCIFTWHGCIITIKGKCHAYISEETPMNIYLNTHAILQEKRKIAKESNKTGPIVLVIGPTDSGKSSLCQILVNYAARLGEHVSYVDLDVGQNDISIPGCIASICVDKPMDIEHKWAHYSPLVYFYGYTSPENDKLYNVQMDNLVKALKMRDERDEKYRSSGWIINTCGWIDGKGYKIILDTIDKFSPDVVIVMDHERLLNDIKNDVKNENITIVKLPKSGGVVTRTTIYRKKSRNRRIKEYFYGKEDDLRPHSKSVNINSFSFFRIGGGLQVPVTALPIGHSVEEDDSLKISSVVPDKELVNCVLGVSYAETEDKLLESNVAGFIYVERFEKDEKKKLSCLTPTLMKIPSKLVIVGGLKWLD